MPPILAFGKISEDFLDQALYVFVGFWVIMIIVGVSYFTYILVSVKRQNRSKPK